MDTTAEKFSETRLKVHPFLPLFLRILAVILFFYWGLTHLIKPEVYLSGLMGISQFQPSDAYDLWSANLIGVLNVAFAITIWRAASDPSKHKIIIDMIILVSLGTIVVFVISILWRGISQREWVNVGLITVSVLILAWLYPKQK